MNYFNLLPNAREASVAVPRSHYSFAVSVMVVIGCLWGMHVWLIQWTDDLSEQLTSIKASIAELTAAPINQDASSLYTDMTVFTQALFRELTQIKASSLCITKITREKNDTHLVGNVRSATDLTAFLQRWPSEGLFVASVIDRLQLGKTAGLIFDLRLTDNQPIFHAQKKPHAR